MATNQVPGVQGGDTFSALKLLTHAHPKKVFDFRIN